MSEKNYKKKIDFQKNMISRQSERIETLKSQIEKLKLECEKKEEEIKSLASLNDEMRKTLDAIKKYKNEYETLIKDLKNMREVMNQNVFKGKWKLIKFLLK